MKKNSRKTARHRENALVGHCAKACLILVFANLGAAIPALASDIEEETAQAEAPINLSLYAFHDNNDNGVYDLGDIAMSSVEVFLLHNELVLKNQRTNGNGFANFKTALNNPEAVLNTAGIYGFGVKPPPGWHITTNNGLQVVRIDQKAETRSRLFLTDYMAPVGLAPDKWIAGIYGLGKPGTLELRNDSGAKQKLALTPGEAFRFEAPMGRYTLSSQGASLDIEMGHSPVHVGKFLQRPAISGQQRTALFDDLSRHALFKIPNGYLGLNWKDINIIRRDFSPGANQGYVNGVRSGDTLAYTSQARHGEIAAAKPFAFLGVYLTSAWQQSGDMEVIVQMWRDDEMVVEDRLWLTIFGPIHYQPRVPDITRVRFIPVNGWQIVFEDLTVAFSR